MVLFQHAVPPISDYTPRIKPYHRDCLNPLKQNIFSGLIYIQAIDFLAAID